MELNYMERFLNNKINIDKIRESSINVYRRNITICMNNMELLKDIHEEIKLANAITRNPFRKIKQIKNPEKVNVKDYFELSEIKRIIKETYKK